MKRLPKRRTSSKSTASRRSSRLSADGAAADYTSSLKRRDSPLLVPEHDNAAENLAAKEDPCFPVVSTVPEEKRQQPVPLLRESDDSVSSSDDEPAGDDEGRNDLDTSNSSSSSVPPPSSRRGRVPYTTDVKPPLAPRPPPSSEHTPENNNVAAANTTVIRRRRRIGRPFTASSPLGWNEEYLSSLISTEEHDDDGLDAPPSPDGDDGRLFVPAMGNDDFESKPSMSQLRRRRGARSAGEPETSSTSSPPDHEAAARKKQEETETERKNKEARAFMSFSAFRMNYLIVHIAIMLADGLQGTHLYVLYEGYGYSVASLYCLGFLTGAVTSPFIGPFVDKIGRKKAAMLYCSLEMFINWLEQFPYFYGLIISRMIGGITTNLLFSVFESWLVTEHRRRGYAEEKLEIILRDSVILSNLAAIASGFLAEFLAVKFGPVGPFEGAVTCTGIALVLVMTMWRENYGSESSDVAGVKSVRGYMTDAFNTIKNDSNISRIGLTQGLTEGSLQTFVFLWSPALARFAANAPSNAIGLDANGEPAYGLIFGAFMACGVAGGLSEPFIRKATTYLVRDHDRRAGLRRRDTVLLEGLGDVKPAAVEFMATAVYLVCACLLMTPYIMPADSPYSFSVSLLAFLLYEFMVGLYMPCEGVIRSIYMPTSSVCSVMTMLRVIVNIAVALGVISTNYIPFKTAFAAVSILMMTSAAIQLSMVDSTEWTNFVCRVSRGSLNGSKRPLVPLGKIPESESLALPPLAMSPNVSLTSGLDDISEGEGSDSY